MRPAVNIKVRKHKIGTASTRTLDLARRTDAPKLVFVPSSRIRQAILLYSRFSSLSLLGITRNPPSASICFCTHLTLTLIHRNIVDIYKTVKSPLELQGIITHSKNNLEDHKTPRNSLWQKGMAKHYEADNFTYKRRSR